MLLFDEKERALEGAIDHNGDIFSYYNDSARPEIGIIRTLVESWFSRYPEEERKELKDRFKVTFNHTFYELYIFILFCELGYELKIHPDTPGTSKHPDYLATKGKSRIYIEVKYMDMLSQNEQSLERKKNSVLEALDKTDASNFLLKINEIEFKDNSQPRGKDFIRYFNTEIAAADPNVCTAILMAGGFNALPEIIYEDDRIRINIQLIPKSPDHRGENTRSIGMHPYVTQIGNNSENIIDSLESKATRYGKLDAPFIICLNKQAVIFDLMELHQALYGSLKLSWSENPKNRAERTEFDGSGFFGSKVNPKFTRVSGVYLTNVNSANLASTAEHAFKHNPFAKFPTDLVIKDSVKNIFHTADNYPYEGPFQSAM